MLKINKKMGLETLPPDTKIARYFTRKKFNTLLKEQTIWFANSKTFDDNHERKIPSAFFLGWDEEHAKSYKKNNDGIDEKISAYISCWTVFNCENYALWKIYDPDSTGVCIVTTVEELTKQVNRPDMVLCKVEYIDPDNTEKRINLPWIIFEPYSDLYQMRVKENFKILPYKYENEVRGIIYKRDKVAGIAAQVNVVELTKEIYLNPFMTEDAYFKLKKKLEKTFNASIFKESIIDEKQKKDC